MVSRGVERWRGALLVVASVLLAQAGCDQAAQRRAAGPPATPVPFLSVDELAQTLSGDGGVVLVEFCVPVGCARCDAMRQPIDRLAGRCGDNVTVGRVHIGRNPRLAWEFGVRVCPTYVAFHDGQEIYRAAYPTSVDLIAGGLDEALGGADPGALSLAVQ